MRDAVAQLVKVGIAVVTVATALLIGGLAAHAQHCETVQCVTADCWWVGPGQRRCRRVCKRRCWHPAEPRYQPRVQAPEPRYEPPRYAAPAQVYQATPRPTPAASSADPGLLIVVLGGIALVILLVAAAAAGERAAVDQFHTATDATRSDAQQADALAAKATTTADEIDRYIAQQIAQAYDRGRTSLSEAGHER